MSTVVSSAVPPAGAVVKVVGGRHAGAFGRVRRVERNGLVFVTAGGHPWGWLIPAENLKPLGGLHGEYAEAVARIRGD